MSSLHSSYTTGKCSIFSTPSLYHSSQPQFTLSRYLVRRILMFSSYSYAAEVCNEIFTDVHELRYCRNYSLRNSAASAPHGQRLMCCSSCAGCKSSDDRRNPLVGVLHRSAESVRLCRPTGVIEGNSHALTYQPRC